MNNKTSTKICGHLFTIFNFLCSLLYRLIFLSTDADSFSNSVFVFFLALCSLARFISLEIDPWLLPRTILRPTFSGGRRIMVSRSRWVTELERKSKFKNQILFSSSTLSVSNNLQIGAKREWNAIYFQQIQNEIQNYMKRVFFWIQVFRFNLCMCSRMCHRVSTLIQWKLDN